MKGRRRGEEEEERCRGEEVEKVWGRGGGESRGGVEERRGGGEV